MTQGYPTTFKKRCPWTTVITCLAWLDNALCRSEVDDVEQRLKKLKP